MLVVAEVAVFVDNDHAAAAGNENDSVAMTHKGLILFCYPKRLLMFLWSSQFMVSISTY